MRLSLAVLMSAALLLAACGDDSADAESSDTGPAAVIEAYTEAYNSGDIDAVMVLFTEDSVVTGHPFSNKSEGLLEIRTVQIEDISSGASENAYTISNVEVSGDTVTWDHLWVSDDGSEFCQTGQTAVIEDGKIVSWTWPTASSDCPE